MAEGASVYPTLPDRSVKNTICLFDVDGTLTPARRVIIPPHYSPTPPPLATGVPCPYPTNSFFFKKKAKLLQFLTNRFLDCFSGYASNSLCAAT